MHLVGILFPHINDDARSKSHQSYTIFFITVNVVHVSGGFSAHHQELKNCKHNVGYMPSLLAATTSVDEVQRILYNVACCWLYLKECINDARFHERQISTFSTSYASLAVCYDFFSAREYLTRIPFLWNIYVVMGEGKSDVCSWWARIFTRRRELKLVVDRLTVSIS